MAPPARRDASAALPTATRELLRRTRRGTLQGPGYERPARGVHRSAGGPPLDHGHRIAVVRAALLRPAARAELSAARTYGVREAGPDDDVVVVARPPLPRSREGLVVRRCRLEPHELGWSSRGWVTTPVRTTCDVLRVLPRARAIRTADALLHRTGLGAGEVDAALRALPPRARGVALARERLDRLDPAAEPARESDLRLALVDAGLPVPVGQHEVRDAHGRFVARLDLAWPWARVAVEDDGAHHRGAEQRSRDLERHDRLRAPGWTVLPVDARMLASPEALLTQLGALLGRRERRGADPGGPSACASSLSCTSGVTPPGAPGAGRPGRGA